ncbi:hypothetical protein HK096_009639, partial [Nowakowskiella sp. JEL0078]
GTIIPLTNPALCNLGTAISSLALCFSQFQLNFTLSFVRIVRNLLSTPPNSVEDKSITNVFVDLENISENISVSFSEKKNRISSPRADSRVSFASNQITPSESKLESQLIDKLATPFISAKNFYKLDTNQSMKQISLSSPSTIINNFSTNTTPAILLVKKPYLIREKEWEIELNLNDQVLIEAIFQDNWAFGKNIVSDQTGYFPINNFSSDDFLQKNLLDIPKLLFNHTHRCNEIRSESIQQKQHPLDQKLDNQKITDSLKIVSGSLENPSENSKPMISELLVVLPYFASKDDELSLTPGDRIILEKFFDDGWGFGALSDTYGFFPMSLCI